MEIYTPLRSLCPRGVAEVVCVRLCRLWYHRGGADRGPIKDIHMVPVDSEGDAVHAIVPQGFLQPFINVLHEGNVYEFSRFRLVKKLEVMRHVDTEFAIVFTHLTTVRRRDGLSSTLLEHHYSLTPLSCLPSPTADPGCLVDVLGTICAVSEIQTFEIPARKNALLKRHVYLGYLRYIQSDFSLFVSSGCPAKHFLPACCSYGFNGHEVKIVLWGNCALRFNGDAIRALGQTKSVIAIFVGTTIQAYDGIKGLAAGAPCSWYIDDNIIDIKKFHARYWFLVIASDRTGEAEFTLFGSLATQMKSY